MSKIIKCKLDVESLEKAIDELNAYQDEIMSKLESFIDMLVSMGVSEANSRANSYLGDSKPAKVTTEYILKSKDTIIATVALVGEDAVFIEFGAGIYYNNGNINPKGAELGFTIGSFPSEHPPNRAIHPGFWWYKGDDGNKHLSFGTQATMPIYFASETMRNNALQKALEVFRS